jgi:Mlc titration factor MtfA (ptsG expression regulator)
MSDEKEAPFNSSAALIEEAKKERERLLAQIEQSQRTIEHSRQIIARIDEALAATNPADFCAAARPSNAFFQAAKSLPYGERKEVPLLPPILVVPLFIIQRSD